MVETPNIDSYDATVRRLAGGGYVHGMQFFDLVRDRGVAFESVKWTTWRGTGYRRGRERACFGNATLLAATRPELTYCEGWTATDLGFAFHHAWCVTEDGRVVDPTLREHDRDVAVWEYRGVPFTAEAVATIMERQDVFGLLVRRWVFEEFDPLWVPEKWRSR